MGNCAASKLGVGEEDEAVALCRDRKRLLKATLHHLFTLAESHDRYIHSLNGVAAALDLFVARHSAPVPILITLPPESPPPTTPPDPPSYLRQTPSEPKTESLVPGSSLSSSSSPASSKESCGYFFSGPPQEPMSPQTVFGWDFFNPFDEMPMLGGLCRGSEEEDLRAVREQEGIPELEEEEGVVVAEEVSCEKEEVDNGEMVERVVEGGEEVGKEKGLTVMEPTARERELLEALRDIEDQFIRAYDSGKDVSRMLEASNIHLNSGLDEIKENSSKLIQAITWHRSPSSLSSSSSYKSNLASSYKDSSWAESKNVLFDNCGGMASGSHSQTLGRLYAWEKKLYEEVKAGDQTRQAYEKKCLQLKCQDAKGADPRSVDKTRGAVRELYTRIWVALRSAETISKRIEKVRDEELEPQLIELLQGLVKTWKIMLESHETQRQIILEVTSFTCPSYGRFCSDSQRYVTLQLEAELRNWRACFTRYIAAQRAYTESLYGWLSKFFRPDIEYYSQRSSTPSYRIESPLLLICHEWLTSCRNLPDSEVSLSLKAFIRDIRVLWVKQGVEQQQKRRVDSLAKELDRRVLALQKAENRVLESKLSELKPEPDVRQRVEYLAGRRDLIDVFRMKLEAEKAKHQECMQETHRVTLSGFKTSLAKVFESLTEFSRDSHKLYDGLLVQNDKAEVKVDQKVGQPSPVEGLVPGVDGR